MTETENDSGKKRTMFTYNLDKIKESGGLKNINSAVSNAVAGNFGEL